MNFRDMGPFENLPYTHVNIGFYLSDPLGPFPIHLLCPDKGSVIIYGLGGSGSKVGGDENILRFKE